MTDLEQLIETAFRLSNTLSLMADNEIKFGADLCYRIEQMSYQAYCTANEIKELRMYLSGGEYEPASA